MFKCCDQKSKETFFWQMDYQVFMTQSHLSSSSVQCHTMIKRIVAPISLEYIAKNYNYLHLFVTKL